MKRIFAAAALTAFIVQPSFADDDRALACETFPHSNFAAAWKDSEAHRIIVTGNPDRYKAYDNFITNVWSALDTQAPVDTTELSFANLQTLLEKGTVAEFSDHLQTAFLTAWDKADDMRAFKAHAALVISLDKESPSYLLNIDFPAGETIYGYGKFVTFTGLPKGSYLNAGDENEDGSWKIAWDSFPSELILTTPTVLASNVRINVTATIEGNDGLFTTPMVVQKERVKTGQDSTLSANFPDAVFYADDLRARPLKEQQAYLNILGLGAQDGMNIQIRIHRGENPKPENYLYASLADNLGIFAQLGVTDPMVDLLGAAAMPRASFNQFYHGASLAGWICKQP